MTERTPFGPMIDGSIVENAVIAHLKKWYSTYLAEVERQAGVDAGTWKRPRAWITTNEFDNFPEAQLPAVLLICPGLAGKPMKTGGHGKYRAPFSLATAVIVSAATRADAIMLSKKHSLALRAVMVQKASIGGFALGCEWIGEVYDDLGHDSSRSIAVGKSQFIIEVDDVLTQRRGPAASEPQSDPLDEYDEDITVETVTTRVVVE